MDKKLTTNRPKALGTLKAVLPIMVMATPLANASIRPASVSRSGANKHSIVVENLKPSRQESNKAFSAFGHGSTTQAAQNQPNTDALEFLKDNNFLAGNSTEEIDGEMTGDLINTAGRKSFMAGPMLSCFTAGGTNIPWYSYQVSCESNGYIWNGGADTDAPVFSNDAALDGIVVTVGGTAEGAFEAFDDGSGTNLTFSLSSSNESIIQSSDLQISDNPRSGVNDGSGVQRHLFINDVVGQGVVTLTIRATDEAGNFAERTLSVTAGALPEFDDADDVITLTVLEDSGSNDMPLSSLAVSDLDSGQTLDWSILTNGTLGIAAVASSSVATPATAATPSSGSYSPSLNAVGSDSFTVAVSDGIDTDNLVVNVTITPVNDEPSISTLANQTFGGTGGSAVTVASFASMTATGGGSDEAGQAIIDYVVSESTDTDNVITSVDIENNGTLTFTPAANVEGVATIEAQVQDDGGVTGGGDDLSQVETFTITVDTLAPTLAEVTVVSTPTGDTTPSVTFSATEAGTLAVGGSCGSANEGAVSSGNTTITLTQTDNATPLVDGTYSDCTLTVTDSATNVSNVLTLSSFQVVSDTVDPTVTSVAVPTDGTYIAGQSLEFTVNLDESVVVDTTAGTPSLALTIGSVAQAATYVSGSGSSALVFSYTVQTDDLDTDGISIASLALNGGVIADAAGNPLDTTLASVADSSAVLVDAVAPVVTSVTVPIPNTFLAGETIDFVVKASEVIIADTTGGTPSIELTIGTETVVADYVGGTNRDEVVFRYLVRVGDEDTDGITIGAMSLNGGSFVDTAGNLIDPTLQSVGDTSGVLIDGLAPVISDVAVPTDGAYLQGQALNFFLTTSEVVELNTGFGSTPFIDLTIGSDTVNANFVAISGQRIQFQYVVETNDLDTDGIAVGILNATNGQFSDLAGNPLDRTLNNLDSTTAVLVDAVTPTVTSVSVPADGTYSAGQTLSFTVNATEDIAVDTTSGTPQIGLTLGSNARDAVYVSGSGTSALVFSYTVQAGDDDTDGVSVGALDLNGGSLADTAGNAMMLALNSVADTSAVLVDTTAPSIAAVTVPAADTYVAGDSLSFSVSTDEIVSVDTTSGTPSLGITLGGASVSAAYVSGSDSSTLTFAYLVQNGDLDSDGIAVDALNLNAGTMTDVAGNDLTLTLANVADASGVLVDAVAPTVTSVAVPADDTYAIGTTLSFTVTTSEVLSVSGSPQLALTIGSATVNAEFISASGTDMLFGYTVQAGDLDSDGIAVDALDLNGATITDVIGNALVADLAGVATTAAVLVDGIVPTISSVAVPANATYVAGQTLSFTVNTSESVVIDTVSGAPELSLTIGSASRVAEYVSGSGSTALLFSYTVLAGDEDSDGIAVDALSANGASIDDITGNAADLTLNSVAATAAVLVDAVIPTVTSVAVPTAGSYVAGDVLTFTVNTSENITLDTTAGSPTIELTVGATTQSAAYVGGSGSNALVFSYTVQAGEEDTDGVLVGLLSANGAILADAAGNALDVTLNSVGATTAVLVDAIPPSITGLEVTASGSYKAGDTLTLTVATSELITVDTAAGTPAIGIDIGGVSRAAQYVSGSGSAQLVFTYTVADGDNDADGIALQTLSLNGGTLSDGAGNALTLTLPMVDTSGILVDTLAPSLTSFTRLTPSTENTAADSVRWTVTFSEIVNGVTATSFALNGTTANIALSPLTGTTYQVEASGGDLASLNGIVGLDLSAGATIADVAGNALVVAEPATDETFTLDNTAPTTAVSAPSVTATASADVTYTVTYADADSVSLAASDIVLETTGTADATITVTGSGAETRTVTLSAITGDGTLGITVPASTAVDAVGNLAEAGGTSATFSVDNTLPTVEITAPINSPDAFPITITFSEDVTGLVDTDITATNATISDFAGSGTTYTATVTPTVAGTDVTLEVAADVSEDAVGNLNAASSLVTVTTNSSGSVSINGVAIEGQTLTAIVTDPDDISGAITYQWMSTGSSAATVVGADETYVIQASDIGNTLSVNVSYTDDSGFAETASSPATAIVISIEQNAWNNIAASVGAVSAAPTFDDYRNVGLTSLTDTELTRMLSIINRAVANQLATGDIDELSELEALIDVILEGQDDDEDGLPNMLEDDGITDTDRDGIDDRDDVDADNNGIRDNLEIDALINMDDDDSDGIVNLFDIDVDGDGNADFSEYTDANLNGVVDEFETLAGFIDSLNPDEALVVTPAVTAAAVTMVASKSADVDTDGDGIINSLDIDADGDGIFDVIEAGLSDTDENALVDTGTALIDDYADLPDTDTDGIADFLEVKSNDVDTDLSLGGVLAALDLDLDGMIDVTTDVDQDGLADVVDNAIGAFGSAKDFDGDGIPNHLDPDDDNDNRTDVEENAELAQFFTGEDADGDGIDDGFDALINGVVNGVDENGNGVRDDRELPDLDGDGLVDYLDDDADNDGIRDDIDTEIALPVQLAPGATEDDLDGDGVLDAVDPSVNTDVDVKVASKGSMSLGILMLLAGALVLMRRRTRLLVAMPLAIVAGHSQAEESQVAGEEVDESNFSFVTSIGVSKFATDLADTVELTDETGAGYVFGLGYNAMDELAVEVTYGVLGKAGVNTGWVDYSSLAVYLQYRPEVVSYGKLRGQFKLGVNRLFYDGAAGLNLDEKSADILTFAVGADYAVNNKDAVEFMFTSYAEDVRLYSIGYRHNF